MNNMMDKWIKCEERLPEQDGKYLGITYSRIFGGHVIVCGYAKNLYKVDKFDFRKGDFGWYDFDGEVGYYKLSDIVAWMELPEIPDEYKKQ